MEVIAKTVKSKDGTAPCHRSCWNGPPELTHVPNVWTGRPQNAGLTPVPAGCMWSLLGAGCGVRWSSQEGPASQPGQCLPEPWLLLLPSAQALGQVRNPGQRRPPPQASPSCMVPCGPPPQASASCTVPDGPLPQASASCRVPDGPTPQASPSCTVPRRPTPWASPSHTVPTPTQASGLTKPHGATPPHTLGLTKPHSASDVPCLGPQQATRCKCRPTP